MKRGILFAVIGILFFNFQGISQEEGAKQSLVQWMDFETAVEKQQTQPKPIFLDMYTDWCGWCKKLDTETFSNPQIANYINTYFYPVKFDAETTDTIEYKGKSYTNSMTGRRSTHSLALQLLENRASYPSMVYIDPNGNTSKSSGFMEPKNLEPILVYFAEGINRTVQFEDYKLAFNAVYRPEESIKPDVSGNIRWITLQDAFANQATNPKKIMIVFVSDYYQRVSSHLMEDITLKDPKVANFINETYYPVIFQSSTTDTIQLFNQTFVNEQKGLGYPHQLVISLLQQRIAFPSIVFFNESNELLSPIQGYFTPKIIEPYLHFIAKDKYKEGDWQQYFQNYYRVANPNDSSLNQ